VVLAYKNGAPVRVRDIGVAVDAPEDRKVAAWAYRGAAAPADSGIANDRSILLVIFKEPGANVIGTVDRIKAALPRLRGVDPADDRGGTPWSTARRPFAPRCATSNSRCF